ncbi:MAG: hypothetical protein U0350_20050 [Caldilineaceae bacterium]
MLPLSDTSSFYRIIFNVALTIWWVPEAIGAFFQRSGVTATRLDRGSYVVLAASNLGQPYSEYMERTWRFIPFIW